MKIKLKLLAATCLTMFSFASQAQHVIGFFPNWRNAGEENLIQYDKITDIIYCFIQPNSTGQFPAFNTWPSSDQTKFNNIKTKAKAKGVKVRISSGGAGSAFMYSPLAANATYRTNFASTVADFIVANDIDGFDVDWEFPASNETGNLDLLLQAFRSAFEAKQTAGYRKIHLGIDVGGEMGHTAYFSKNFVNFVDEVNIMAYDLAGGFAKTSLAKTSFDIWKTYLGAVNASKLVLGIPFYTSGQGLYSGLAHPYSTGAANAYNGTLSGSDGTSYNAAPSIKDKIDYTMQNGGGGVMIWELSQDILDANYYQYSLLSAIHVALKPYTGPSCAKPVMGGNKSLCGTAGTINLSSGLSIQNYRTFTWYKNGQVIGGNSASIAVNSAGTYTVKVDSSGVCNSKDSVVITATIGTVDLGSTMSLCSPTTKTLDAGITGTGIQYQWSKDGTTLPEETNQTYMVRRPGAYKVIVNASGCTSVNGTVTITSTLPEVADQTNCNAGPVTFTVNNPGADNFEWYDAATGGTLLNTGTTYSTTINTNQTYYVVKKGALVGNNCIGLPTWDANTIFGAPGQAYNVVYNNVKYTAQWWTQGDLPSAGSVWLDKGSCGTPGCDRMAVYASISSCTGIENVEKTSNDLLVQPNPTKGKVNIVFSASSSEKITISLTGIQGTHTTDIFHGVSNAGNNNLSLDLPTIPAGIYVLKISGGTVNRYSKLVIE